MKHHNVDRVVRQLECMTAGGNSPMVRGGSCASHPMLPCFPASHIHGPLPSGHPSTPAAAAEIKSCSYYRSLSFTPLALEHTHTRHAHEMCGDPPGARKCAASCGADVAGGRLRQADGARRRSIALTDVLECRSGPRPGARGRSSFRTAARAPTCTTSTRRCALACDTYAYAQAGACASARPQRSSPAVASPI